jgi:hypothetical protein
VDIKRKITLGAATLAVAFGAGHLVQSGRSSAAATRAAEAAGEAAPTRITPLAASTEADRIPPAPRMAAIAVPRGTIGPVDRGAASRAAARAETVPTPVALTPDDMPPVAPPSRPAPAPAIVPPAAVAPPAPAPRVAPPASAPVVDACQVTLDVVPGAHGMLDLTLLSPCKPSTRVVLRHGGLAVTGRTSASGALFTALPAMESPGEVSAMFPDGTVARGAAPVDLSGIRRFAVQWMGDDRFALNAYQGGAAYGAPGHVHAGAEGQADGGSGWMIPLGDASVDLPMLAEVYTWPAQAADVAIDLEATVTEATCNRELLGETLESQAGKVVRADITLAMPDCAAVGDFLVLNNLLAGMTTAAAE